MAKTPNRDDIFGLLVGWTHNSIGDKIDLRLETVPNSHALVRKDIESTHVVMTHQQAAVLANYLFRITDQTPPLPKRGKLRRWFGG